MSWTDQEVKETEGKFLKVKEGTPIDIHILDENPYKEAVHYINKKRLSCIDVNCEHCEAGDKPKDRWSTNVYELNQKKVFVFELGSQIMKQIKEIAKVMAEDGQTIDGVDFRISAKGTGLDTEYSVVQRPRKPIPGDIVKYRIP